MGPEDHTFLAGEVRRLGLAQNFDVANDALGSLRAGVTDGVGVVIACGTGFATAARNRDGQFWHGSFWLESLGGTELGHSALRAVYRAELGIDPPTSLTAPILTYFGQDSVEALLRLFTMQGIPHPRYGQVSRLAPLVLQECAQGDSAARAIVDDIAHRAVNYALVAARKVDLLGQPFTLVLNGGLFRDAGGILLAAIQAELTGRAADVTLVRARYEPAVGALLHAFDRAGLPLDNVRLARIEATLPPNSLFATHT
ncbi:MAG: hypothetical protein IPK19_08225 [Chloroflexi bacterium]|nr:hypothetical protein [Chloroflexota bacterium]